MSLSFLLKSFSEEDPKPIVKKEPERVSLAGALQRERLKQKKAKNKRPASNYFNPSLVTYGYCRRSKVGQLLGLHQPLVDLPTPKEQLMFDMGHKIHDIIQGYFWDVGMLEGEFRCRQCKETWYAVSPEACPKRPVTHGRKFMDFREISLKNDEFQMRGRADGIVLLEVEKEIERHLMDIKSIANRLPTSSERQFCFEDLKDGPKQDHVVQLNFYMWMSGIHKGHLFYVAKNSHQIKSFYLEHDYGIIEGYLDDIRITLDWTEDIRQGKRGDLPETCSRKDCDCENLILRKV